MAIVGLKLVKLALVDPKTQQLIKGPEGLSTDGVIQIDSWKDKRLKYQETTKCKML